MKREKTKRDKEITRQIHRLFWKANFYKKWPIFVTFITRVPAFTMTHVLMPVTVAYALQAIVERDFNAATHYALIVLLLSVAFGALWIPSSLLITKHGAEAGVYLQRMVFENFLNKDYDFYANTYFGSLGAQAMQLRESFNEEYNQIMFIHVPRQSVIVFGGIIVLAFSSPPLAIVTLLSMILVLGFTIASGSWRLKWRRRVSERNNEVAGFVGDALTGATVVKSFASEDYEQKRLSKSLLPWSYAQRLSWSTAIPADVGRYLLIGGITALLVVMTTTMYKNGTISLAVVALVQLYVVKMVAVAGDISENIKMYEHAMGGAYEPVKTMMIQPTIKDKPVAQKFSKNIKSYPMTFKDVTFHYEDAAESVSAVKDFDLAVKSGEKIGLVGYSGSGKTTITKLLLRFMDVTAGGIEIADLDIRDVAQKDLRHKMAYVPQEPMLFHRSIYENIAYGRPEASEKEVHAAAKMAYVDEFVQELPKGYDTMVGERGVKLSGGQRQRVAIARAILKDAPILVLDEATSALDSRSEQLIQKALRRLMQDRTSLVIAHRLSTIQRMDRIIVMDKGKIVQLGTHDELLKDNKGIYAELWSHQSGGYIGLSDDTQSE